MTTHHSAPGRRWQDEEQHDRAKDHELQPRHCSGSAAACRRISQQGLRGPQTGRWRRSDWTRPRPQKRETRVL